MSNVRLQIILSGFLLGMLWNVSATSSNSGLTMKALSEPSLGVMKSEIKNIQYQIINHSDKEYKLSMKPLKGVMQETGLKSFCDKDKPLKAGESCILSLLVNAHEATGLHNEGPLLCENEWDWDDQEASASGVCVKPKPEERLNVYPLQKDIASLSVMLKKPLASGTDNSFGRCFSSFAGCTLVLFQNTDSYGILEVTNTSTVTAYGIKATGLPPGVTFSEMDSSCGVVAPGKKCTLLFYPGAVRNLGTTVAIQGTNTVLTSITMQVLGVGDTLDGNQLFQLPRSQNNYTFYAALPSDTLGSPSGWNPSDCTGTTQMPAITQLQRLYQASSCNGGPIGNFFCPGSYWSATENAADALAINFTSGTQQSVPQGDMLYTRCVQRYELVPV